MTVDRHSVMVLAGSFRNLCRAMQEGCGLQRSSRVSIRALATLKRMDGRMKRRSSQIIR